MRRILSVSGSSGARCTQSRHPTPGLTFSYRIVLSACGSASLTSQPGALLAARNQPIFRMISITFVTSRSA